MMSLSMSLKGASPLIGSEPWKAFVDSCPWELPPDWLGEIVLRHWSVEPTPLKFYRAAFDRIDVDRRRQLVRTGLGRRGAVKMSSRPASELARLARSTRTGGRR